MLPSPVTPIAAADEKKEQPKPKLTTEELIKKGSEQVASSAIAQMESNQVNQPVKDGKKLSEKEYQDELKKIRETGIATFTESMRKDVAVWTKQAKDSGLTKQEAIDAFVTKELSRVLEEIEKPQKYFEAAKKVTVAIREGKKLDDAKSKDLLDQIKALRELGKAANIEQEKIDTRLAGYEVRVLHLKEKTTETDKTRIAELHKQIGFYRSQPIDDALVAIAKADATRFRMEEDAKQILRASLKDGTPLIEEQLQKVFDDNVANNIKRNFASYQKIIDGLIKKTNETGVYQNGTIKKPIQEQEELDKVLVGEMTGIQKNYEAQTKFFEAARKISIELRKDERFDKEEADKLVTQIKALEKLAKDAGVDKKKSDLLRTDYEMRTLNLKKEPDKDDIKRFKELKEQKNNLEGKKGGKPDARNLQDSVDRALVALQEKLGVTISVGTARQPGGNQPAELGYLVPSTPRTPVSAVGETALSA